MLGTQGAKGGGGCSRLILMFAFVTLIYTPSNLHTLTHTHTLLTLEQGQGRELYGFALRAELGRTLGALLLGLPDRLPGKSIHFVHGW